MINNKLSMIVIFYVLLISTFMKVHRCYYMVYPRKR